MPGEDVYEEPRLAELYDFLNPWTHQDDFYLAQARRLGGPVLDLGCGTGQLAVRIAEEGIEVVGAEPAAGMIGVARARAGGERVEWVQSSGEALELGRRFRLVYMTGHAFQAVPTDEGATALLARVAQHLEPEGRFIFETRNPADAAWERWAGPRTEVATEEYGRMFEDYEIDASEAPDRISMTHHIHLVDRGEELVRHSRLRFPSKELVEGEFVEAGLELVEWYGDWDGSPLRGDSAEMIAVTRARQ
ncbi:MAG: class I SAM-dependent methyltransferase [Dehalococcoidia bacterium]|nr:class I SAM-dependent methyltransferase [Dehalococcoidia bacterium]